MPAKKEAFTESVPDAVPTKYDAELANFREWTPQIRKDMGYMLQDDPRHVMGVPADMTVTWATDPRQDGGGHLSFIRGLGFRPVRKEEVTTEFTEPDKLVLRAFEVGPHDYVVVGGGVLMIGYKQYRDERRAAARAQAERRLDANSDRLDTQGVQQTATVRTGPLSEVM